MGAKFSPTPGGPIAFASDRSGSGYDIYLLNLSDAAGSTPAKVRRLTYGANNSFSRTWSPDGKRIVFNSMRWTSEGSSGSTARSMALAGQLWMVEVG